MEPAAAGQPLSSSPRDSSYENFNKSMTNAFPSMKEELATQLGTATLFSRMQGITKTMPIAASKGKDLNETSDSLNLKASASTML